MIDPRSRGGGGGGSSRSRIFVAPSDRIEQIRAIVCPRVVSFDLSLASSVRTKAKASVRLSSNLATKVDRAVGRPGYTANQSERGKLLSFRCALSMQPHETACKRWLSRSLPDDNEQTGNCARPLSLSREKLIRLSIAQEGRAAVPDERQQQNLRSQEPTYGLAS